MESPATSDPPAPRSRSFLLGPFAIRDNVRFGHDLCDSLGEIVDPLEMLDDLAFYTER